MRILYNLSGSGSTRRRLARVLKLYMTQKYKDSAKENNQGPPFPRHCAIFGGSKTLHAALSEVVGESLCTVKEK